MVHGGYGKSTVAARKPPAGRRSKGPGVERKPKPKAVTPKNQIRSVKRMLRKELPPEVRAAQEKKLEGIKKQQEIHTRLALERRIFLRYRKIKFFERRKIERSIRRLEKVQRAASSAQAQDSEVAEQLLKLKEDLEYIRFFPKTEKYVALFTGTDRADIVDKRNRLREQIKANLVAAAASGKDLEETGSEDDGLLDVSEDDFFVGGTSSDEADADDELTEQSTREQASSASGKAASGMSSDERNQKHKPAKAPMRPPRPSNHSRSHSNSVHPQSRFGASSSNKSWRQGAETSSNHSHSNSVHPQSRLGASSSKNSWRQGGETSSNHPHSNSVHPQSRFGASSSRTSWRQGGETSGSGNMSSSGSGISFNGRGVSSNPRTGHSSNLSSNSDAHKPRRKRRPKKKKAIGMTWTN